MTSKIRKDSGDAYAAWEDQESRQAFATRQVQFYQRATVADGGDKAKQFVMLLNTFREFGELYDSGHFSAAEDAA